MASTLAPALRGAVTKVSSSTVTDELLPATGTTGEFIPFGAIPDKEQTITLKDAGDDSALVEGTDYELGGEFERLQRISLALGHAFGKQKLQGEEIRQLIEASVPVWSLLEKTTGRNAQELRKMSEAGELGTDVIKQLVATMGATSQGAAAKNMKILSGLVSNMKDR